MVKIVINTMCMVYVGFDIFSQNSLAFAGFASGK
jgi:hypothetical protein